MKTPWIASLDLVGIRPDGTTETIAIRIGTPYQDHATGAWRTPIEIGGIDSRLPDMAGSDSFQSLCMAVSFVRRRLQHFTQAGGSLELPDSGHDSFPFEAYFPSR